MNTSSLVSVIIPTHNRAELVLRAIKSVVQQTYTNLECIVVDDASNDSTEETVRSINDDRIIYLQHENKMHAAASRNTGIKHARGDLIAFLDDDDEWLPTKLEKQVPFILGLPEKVGMVYCWMDYYDHTGKILREVHPTLSGNIFKETLDKQPIGNSSTLLVRSNVVDDIGGLDESLQRSNDGDFIRRVCQKYEVDFIPEALVNIYIEHGYKRITSEEKQGIINAIRAETVKFEKFETELKKNPKQRSNIYTLIGLNYSKQRKWKLATKSYLNALCIFPLNKLLFKRILNSLSIILNRKR